MPDEYKAQLKKEISEILVKWDMPTRQVAINEIIGCFDAYLAQKKREIEGLKLQFTGNVKMHGNSTRNARYYNKGIDAALEILQK